MKKLILVLALVTTQVVALDIYPTPVIRRAKSKASKGGASALLFQPAAVTNQPKMVTFLFTNLPPRWTMSFSTNLAQWDPYLIKVGSNTLPAFTVDLRTTNDAKFLKITPNP